jgi:hypothetical protein
VLRRTLSTLLPAKAVRDRALALGEDHSWPHELPRERVSPPPDEPHATATTPAGIPFHPRE